jgi:hypothetical protein
VNRASILFRFYSEKIQEGEKLILDNSSLFDEFVRKWGLFWHAWAILKRACQKRPNLHTNELNTTFFLFDEPLKGFKSLKTFKISLTFRFDIYQNPFT